MLRNDIKNLNERDRKKKNKKVNDFGQEMGRLMEEVPGELFLFLLIARIRGRYK